MPLSDYHESMKGWTPVESDQVPVTPPIPEDVITTGRFLRATLPLPLQYAPDTLKQYNKPGMSQFRIPPVPPSGIPTVNAAAISAVHSLITQTTTTTDDGDLTWRGNWSPGFSYSVNDLVQFNISTYLALVANTGVEPEGNPGTWALVSKNLNFRGEWSSGLSAYSINSISTGSGTSVNTGVAPLNPTLPTWAASTGFVTGQKIVDSNGNLQTAQIGGTSNPGTHPTWNLVVGGQTIDGAVTWVNGGAPDVISVGDLIYVQVTTHLPTTTSVTDSLGNVFTLVANSPFFSQVFFNDFNMAVYQAFSTSALANGASYTVTYNFSGVTDVWTSRQVIITGPIAPAAGTITLSTFSTSPYMGNGLRAGPITPGPITVPGNALVLFSAAHDNTTDNSVYPSFQWFGSALLDFGYGSVTPGVYNPFVLAETGGSGVNIGWVATDSYFSFPVGGGYEPFDLVLFQGDTYVSIADSSLSPVADPASWALIATGLGSVVNDVNVTGTLLNGVLTLGWAGLLGLSRGGTNANLSATGGTSQVVRQSSVGAPFTVSQLAASDLTNGTTGTGAIVLAGSPTLTGAPLAPTPSPGDNSTKIATTAFVDAAVGSLSGTVAKLSLAMQSAAIPASTIYAVPVSKAGLYRIDWRAAVTQAASTSSSLGGTNGFQAIYTDKNDSVVKTSNPTTATLSAGNTTTTTISGDVYANCAQSTNLQYAFDYSSVGGTAMIYDLDVFVEFVGAITSTQFAFDNFNRANANPIGAPWVKLGTAGGTLEFQIVGTIAEPATAAAAYAGGDYYSGITWPNDQYSEVTIGTLVSGSGTAVGPVVRANGADSWYGFGAANGGTSYLQKFTGSQGLTTLASGTFTFLTGDVVRLTIIGTNLTLTQNGVTILTASDSSYASGFPGMQYYTPGPLTSSTVTLWAGGSPS